MDEPILISDLAAPRGCNLSDTRRGCPDCLSSFPANPRAIPLPYYS
jgi:hypothetical protein